MFSELPQDTSPINKTKHAELIELATLRYQSSLVAPDKQRIVQREASVKHRSAVDIVIRSNTHSHSRSLRTLHVGAIFACTISMRDLREIRGIPSYHIDVTTRKDFALSSKGVCQAESRAKTPRHFLSSFGAGIVLLLAQSTLLRTDGLLLLRETVVRFGKELGYFCAHNMFTARVSRSPVIHCSAL